MGHEHDSEKEASQCEYIFRDESDKKATGRKCNQPAYLNRKCALHADLPKNLESQDFKQVDLDKQRRVAEKLGNRDFNFEGAKLSSFNLSELNIENIEGSLNFTDAFVLGNVDIRGHVSGFVIFSGATLKGDGLFVGLVSGRHELPLFSVLFDEARVEGSVWFSGAQIGGSVRFDGAYVGGFVSFDGIAIDGDVSFRRAGENSTTIGQDVSFADGSKIRGDIWFDHSEIRGNADLNDAEGRFISFDNAKISGLASFETVKATSGLSFKDTDFSDPANQERACRKAKQIWEDLGDRDKADYHFYREMEAKRRQKPQPTRFAEWLFIQLPLKYGTSARRLVGAWILAGLILGIGLAYERGQLSSLLSSWAAIFAPGYAFVLISGLNGYVQLIALVETILAAFFWGAFILVFSRKYMR